MTLYHLCELIEKTTLGSAIRNSDWLFPAIESVHVMGIIVLVGSTGLFDMRLLNTGFLRHERASHVAKQVMESTCASWRRRAQASTSLQKKATISKVARH